MKFSVRLYVIPLLIAVLALAGCRKSDYVIVTQELIADLGGGTGTVTWTNDRSYLLSGFVFVNDGQTLTIEPGTVVRAKSGEGSRSSALIVARGGRIIAEGTPSEPIIFTAEGDDLKGSIPLESRGLWGGVIILGNAPINTRNGEDMVEGIPVSEPRGVYGGPDDEDNSGILRYVSIRHGGANIGEGNEINGLTLGGVGQQTIIDHIEVISNADDGVEFFGGSVNCSNLVVAFCGDDALDFDQGYRGKCQFILGICASDSDKAIESSGGLQPVQALPGSYPTVYNMTLYGDPGNSERPLIDFYGFGGGYFRNSIFMNTGGGIAVSNTGQAGDSYQLFEDGYLALEHSIFYPTAGDFSLIYSYDALNSDFTAENKVLADSLVAWNNQFGNPLDYAGSGYTLLPSTTVFTPMAPYDNAWFEQVTYKGSFGSEHWIEGWTLLWESGKVN
jgi:hypothetical protein